MGDRAAIAHDDGCDLRISFPSWACGLYYDRRRHRMTDGGPRPDLCHQWSSRHFGPSRLRGRAVAVRRQLRLQHLDLHLGASPQVIVTGQDTDYPLGRKCSAAASPQLDRRARWQHDQPHDPAIGEYVGCRGHDGERFARDADGVATGDGGPAERDRARCPPYHDHWVQRDRSRRRSARCPRVAYTVR